MTTSIYDHIQMIINYYDDEDDPSRINWIDIEGMGYGWAWSNYEEKDWHKAMCKVVAYESEYILKDNLNTYYFVYDNSGVKNYHFVNLNQWRQDTIFSFSDNEMFY
ncbi:hypothetical protein ACI2JA_03140 [Alkalihalobacillus sp. NPDC078783]